MNGSKAPSFRISVAEDAWNVTLPADLLAEFPPLFRARIAVGTGEDGPSHAFDATCEKVGEILRVEADPSSERIPFSAADSTTFDIDAYGMDDPDRRSKFWSTPIAELEGRFRFLDRGRCKGCPRDPKLKIHPYDIGMCWCFSKVEEPQPEFE